jgi:hypothetical protein
MNLIYLGQTFDHTVRTPQVYRKPIAVNWRHQIPDESYGGGVSVSPYQPPKVVSWRWQVPNE